MNAKTKTIITIVIALLSIIALVSYVYARSNNTVSEEKLREYCEAGSVDNCNEYIRLQQSEYEQIRNELDNYSTEANKAREVIKQQLSGTFM